MNTKNTAEPRLGSVLRRLMVYAKPYRIGLALSVLLLSAKLVVDIGIAAIQQVFIDTINDAGMSELTRLTVICAIVCTVIILCLMLQHYFRFVTQSRIAWEIRGKLFAKTHRLPYRMIQNMHSGDLISRNNKDASVAVGMINSIVFELGYNLLLCLVAFVYLARTDVWIALLALGAGPVVFLSSRFFDRRLRRLSTAIYKKEAELRGILQETLQGIKVVRAFSLEETLLDKYSAVREELRKMQVRRTAMNGLLWQTSSLINNGVLIACAGLIAYLSLRGGASAGEVLAFLILMGRVQWPFVYMSRTWGGVMEALGASDRVLAILDAPDEQGTVPDASLKPVAAEDAELALSLREVRYSYPGRNEQDEALFDGLNLDIRHGETVAVVGPSGSGKTTLVRLCCGLYPPDSGSISVYGRETCAGLDAARSQITYVPQSPYLFAGTIRDNIGFGADGAGEADIREAARLAGAEEFIDRLPQGYDTVIGEHGSTLSGGQRQRLAIARAFLRNSPLLLLDEATSALDNESERLVQQSLDTLMRNRTSLVIAHRLSTIREASRILVMDRGRIVEEGTHESLLQAGGLYAELYNIQFKPAEAGDHPSAAGVPLGASLSGAG
ncbi:ABC transporter ATP-binding protein [Paenibacillus sp. NFR01]|uniref:ABC transporter ATP-binding protein n=1 Tax=Paenibacillus sp. NFR01 TaxID=1566279 RepID=UPI0008BC5A5E|nr:ABC transporter ATP-binding protein [Paenibacillus sp. NFR01]SEU29517.1 ATP-binding cassette, subfamily B, MsbA [Paenibacillus sp. NFR01]